MAHLHSIYDTDPHFSIDPVTRAIKNESTRKTALVQGDHNSERFTFEVPRFVEGHDMSLSTRIEVHFINFAADKSGQSENVYIVDDMQISPNSEDESIVIFSWLLSTNATTYNGTLAFAIRFVCLTDEKIDYAWHTAPYKGISISEGINNGEKVIEDNSDILAAWERDINELAWRVENLEKNGGGGGEGSSVEVVQGTGESTEAVMSQKATTDALGGKLDARRNTNTEYPQLYQVQMNSSNTSLRILQSTWQDDETVLIGYSAVQRDQHGCVQVATPKKGIDAVNRNYANEHFVEKITTSGELRAYGINANGVQTTYKVKSDNIDAYSIAQRNGSGEIRCATPKSNIMAANKEYVDAVYRHDITLEGGLDYNGTTGYVACSVYSRSNTPWDYSGFDCNLTGRTTATGIITIDGTTYTIVGLAKGEGGVSYFIYYVKSDGTVEKFNFYDGEGTFTDTVTQMI